MLGFEIEWSWFWVGMFFSVELVFLPFVFPILVGWSIAALINGTLWVSISSFLSTIHWPSLGLGFFVGHVAFPFAMFFLSFISVGVYWYLKSNGKV